ncbi:MAG: bifunctional glutamate N-acetyltransferase/amino-acid acetyltransferase ArgJ [Dehalococcoidales bacterium]|nr:bifunctional glutamate N-acetyltransferase/amino-acid acetyltransferase ArgJ [Dehalococcoidales bacterium]
MDGEISFIKSGTVTTPQGFLAGATYGGLKKKKIKGILDLAILSAERSCTGAALFTTNRVKAAPVVLSRQRLQSGRVNAVVVNSGCANTCVGEVGLRDAAEMADLAARNLGISPESVLVASTGVIGKRLPMDLIRTGIKRINVSRNGGHELARAIMTTDTVPKEAAVSVSSDNGNFVIGGAAKGSGMLHPNLATFLCFLTTDAAVEPEFLRNSLQKAADVSFNMVSIDGDTSTNDMALIMADGMADVRSTISPGDHQAEIFQEALNRICIHLAKGIARDGEGANRIIEINVSGTASLADARQVARTIATSSLVKTAVHGKDPNWGRILAAAGRSGVEVIESRIDLSIGNIWLVKAGCPVSFNEAEVVRIMDNSEVVINLDLNLGNSKTTAWGCDLSQEYVAINSEYTT